MAALGVARTFQNIRLFSDLSVLRERDGRLPPSQRQATLIESLLGLPRARREEREAQRGRDGDCWSGSASRTWPTTEAGALSYGDQRRVEIARALALAPEAAAPRRAGGRPERRRDGQPGATSCCTLRPTA